MNEPYAPKLSVVVIIYNMSREIPRTLQSLQAGYQQGVSEDDYEVIVVENGSTDRFNEDAVRQYGKNFRYFYLDKPPPSPAYAVNYGFKKSRGRYVTIMIDGARMVSPNIIGYTLSACRQNEKPVILVPSWHLGPDIQQNSGITGYQ